jgi:hypothetical protein
VMPRASETLLSCASFLPREKEERQGSAPGNHRLSI